VTVKSNGSRPLVSVITAVYNGERYLREALESLFAQDYEPFESIVVDDGSEDGTPEIARSFPVRYHRQENQGAAAARNAGIALARGELIAYLDADDLLPPNKLSVQSAYLEGHPNVGCVLGRQEIMLQGVEPPEWLTRDALYGDLDGIPLVSAMVRKRVLDDLGGFDETFGFAEDRDLFIRMREHGVEITVLPEIMVYRRFHGENTNFRRRPAKHPILRSLKGKLDRERAKGGEEEQGT
jgi:glycosyltransferase involved in cell wall biosynthesis